MTFFCALPKLIAGLRASKLSSFTPALLALLAVGFMVVRIDLDEQHRYEDQQRATVARQLARLAATLNSNINGNVKLAKGLVAAIEVDPDIDQPRFAEISQDLLDGTSQIKDFAAAPDLIVRLIYPLAPNMKLLGLDFRKDQHQRESRPRSPAFQRTYPDRSCKSRSGRHGAHCTLSRLLAHARGL